MRRGRDGSSRQLPSRFSLSNYILPAFPRHRAHPRSLLSIPRALRDSFPPSSSKGAEVSSSCFPPVLAPPSLDSASVLCRFLLLDCDERKKDSRIHRPDGLWIDNHIVRVLLPASDAGGEGSARRKEEGRGGGEEGCTRNRRDSRDGRKRQRPSEWARERRNESSERHDWGGCGGSGGWEKEQNRAQKLKKGERDGNGRWREMGCGEGEQQRHPKEVLPGLHLLRAKLIRTGIFSALSAIRRHNFFLNKSSRGEGHGGKGADPLVWFKLLRPRSPPPPLSDLLPSF